MVVSLMNVLLGICFLNLTKAGGGGQLTLPPNIDAWLLTRVKYSYAAGVHPKAGFGAAKEVSWQGLYWLVCHCLPRGS